MPLLLFLFVPPAPLSVGEGLPPSKLPGHQHAGSFPLHGLS